MIKACWQWGIRGFLMMVAAVILSTAGAPSAKAQPVVTAVDESNMTPQGSEYLRPSGIWSDIMTAPEYDLRYLSVGATHSVGKSSRIVSLLQRVDTFTTRVGRSLETVLRIYQQYRRVMELSTQVKRMYSYMKNYWENFQVTVNLYKLLPIIEIEDPFDNENHFVVGFLPRHGADRWKRNARKYGDNPYLDYAWNVIELKYPKSLSDLTIDASIWGNLSADMDELEFQKRLMAGVYDGVMGASNYLNGFPGAKTNLGDNAKKYLTPARIAAQKVALYDQAISGLTEYRNKLVASQYSSGGSGVVDASADSIKRMVEKLDTQIAQLQTERAYEQDGRGEKSAQASQQVWMERMNFISQVLVKLEAVNRRVAIAKMAEKYDKYEKFWKDPDMMNPTPEITGQALVDNSLYVIWQALTVLSWGKIPPPTPVAGGHAAEAMATITKGQYRFYMSEELRAVRQLVAHSEQQEAKNQAIELAKAGDLSLAQAEANLKAGEGRLQAYQALLTQRSKLDASMLALQTATVQ